MPKTAPACLFHPHVRNILSSLRKLLSYCIVHSLLYRAKHKATLSIRLTIDYRTSGFMDILSNTMSSHTSKTRTAI